MYRKPKSQLTIEDFILPFEGNLSADNRWVKLAGIYPGMNLKPGMHPFFLPKQVT